MSEGIITNVCKVRQGDFTVYTFPLSASLLTQLGVISRLHEQEGGVQRKLDEDRAAGIALAMLDPSIPWLDTILVHMEPPGTWSFNEADGTINYREGFTLSIDDGQHRRYAMGTLSTDELVRLNQFLITATEGMNFEQRLKLFIQQEKRKHIDRNLQLRARHLLGDWKKPIEKEAYEVILSLANDPRSPLCGKIQLDEVTSDDWAAKHRRSAVPAMGLFNTLKSVLGCRSILFGITPSRKTDIVIRYLNVAASHWKEQWDDQEQYFLSSSRGVSVLLKLLVSSNSLRMILSNDDFSDVRLKNALTLASHFDWSFEKHRNKEDRLLLGELDKMMSITHRRRQKEKNKKRGTA